MMKSPIFLKALLIALSLGLVAGCATQGVGGDTALLDDVLTERQILRALYNEPQLSNAPIQVSCIDGKVTLSGFVSSTIEKELAGRVAERINGVESVQNNLTTGRS